MKIEVILPQTLLNSIDPLAEIQQGFSTRKAFPWNCQAKLTKLI
jgi:hypothetical protein